MKPPLGTCDQHMIATQVPTCSAGGVVILPSVVSSRNDLTMENIPGICICGGYKYALHCTLKHYASFNCSKTGFKSLN